MFVNFKLSPSKPRIQVFKEVKIITSSATLRSAAVKKEFVGHVFYSIKGPMVADRKGRGYGSFFNTIPFA